MLNLLQDIQSRLDKLPQNVSNLVILILRHTGCNDIRIGWIRISFNYLGLDRPSATNIIPCRNSYYCFVQCFTLNLCIVVAFDRLMIIKY